MRKVRKNIIIWGPTRCGKTTLARRLAAEFGYNWYGTDAMREFYDELVPGDKIFDQRDFEQGPMMAKALARYISCLNWETKHEGKNFVFEGVSFDLEYLFARSDIDKDDFVVVCLGYDLSPEEKFEQIRKYETEDDWHAERTDEELMKQCVDSDKTSEVVKGVADRLGFRYFDVSVDRDKVLDEVMDYIRGENK